MSYNKGDNTSSRSNNRSHHVCTWKTYVGSKFSESQGTVPIPEHRNNVRIKQIQFQTQRPSDIEKVSVVEVTQRQYYHPNTNIPVPHGPLDSHLGTSLKEGTCATCKKTLVDCVGHFGHISLELPVFHIGYMRDLQRILQSICKKCSHVLVPNIEYYEYYMEQARSVHTNRRALLKIADDILDQSKRIKTCFRCGARNGQVKKVTGLLKFIHDMRTKETKKDRDAKYEEETRRRHRLQQIRKAESEAKKHGLSYDPNSLSSSSLIPGAGNLDYDSAALDYDMASGTTIISNAPQESWYDEMQSSIRTAINYNNEIATHKDKIMIEITPLHALRLLSAIPNDECYMVGINPLLNRPENLILTRVPVPPVAIRPSVSMGSSGTNEDDLTIKLGEIVHNNMTIKQAFERGQPTSTIVQTWDLLQTSVAQLINGDLPGVLKLSPAQSKPIRSLVQRLKGKAGRFRGNLSGKRVDFSGRTVISPDPNLQIDQVGVPCHIAKVLTFPEVVTAFNIHTLRQAVLNGPDIHPGANFIEFQSGNKTNLRFGNRSIAASLLRVGDTVERHLRDDDIVLFNRQPSLHRMSIMAHRAKIHEWRTLRFNECVCTPYNADFDGDEMNIHVPQTYEARAETLELMSVLKNIVTPRHGEPLIAATQDFITGAFLISSKNRFLTKTQLTKFLGFMDDGGMMSTSRIMLPIPALLKPVTLWTGKQCFSLILRPLLHSTLPTYQQKMLTSSSSFLFTPSSSTAATTSGSGRDRFGNLRQPAKRFTDDGVYIPTCDPGYKAYNEINYPSITVEVRAANAKKEHPLDVQDGYIVIRNSELMCGNITKDALGGSKKSMYYNIVRSGPDGPLAAARFLSRLAKFASRFMQSQGFSIGIDDVTPSGILVESKDELVKKGYAQCLEYIEQYKNGQLQLRPGCNELQTLEALLLGELSNIRGDLGSKCFETLNILINSPLIMAISGSKGSKINISQMTACVGQQAISGSRIPEGFHLRTLPHFHKFSREPDAKGFVSNSFYTGLTATEFYFHTMAGREGLIDTAVKTAETGYMQRRLMKALEDLCVQYDGTVRTADGNICQFKYGDDLLDPLYMSASAQPVHFPMYLEQVRAAAQYWSLMGKTTLYNTLHRQSTAVSTTPAATGPSAAKNKRGKKKDTTANDMDDSTIATSNSTTTSQLPSTLSEALFNNINIGSLGSLSSSLITPETIQHEYTHIPDTLSSIIPSTQVKALHKLPSTRTIEPITLTHSMCSFTDWVSLCLSSPLKYTISQHLIIDNPEYGTISDIALSNINNSTFLTLDESIRSARIKELFYPHTLLTPDEIVLIVSAFALHPSVVSLFSTRFLISLLEFIKIEMATMQKTLDIAKLSYGQSLPSSPSPLAQVKPSKTKNGTSSSSKTTTTTSPSTSQSASALSYSIPNEVLYRHSSPISSVCLNMFLNGCKARYTSAIMESGTAVGAIAGQSIGEPGTQMTLKTFHFAGVASMNITQGVPRIKEIINASKKIATPIISVPLENDKDARSARYIKGRIETTTIEEIAKRIDAVFTSQQCCIEIEIDWNVVQSLQLNITVDGICTALSTAKKLKLKDCVSMGQSHVVRGTQCIIISGIQLDKTARLGSYTASSSLLQALTSLRHDVAKVIVQGIPTISRAVINDDGRGTYSLVVEGYGLLSVMAIPGINATQVRSNHIIEIAECLGIEAARQSIIDEIETTMSSHGLTIDIRHLALLADIMTYRGEVLGITRFGIAKMKESALMLASFERTSDHLFEAALRGTLDDVSGVSDSIILGKTIRIGTGLFKVLQRSNKTAHPQIESYTMQHDKLKLNGIAHPKPCHVLDLLPPPRQTLDDEYHKPTEEAIHDGKAIWNAPVPEAFNDDTCSSTTPSPYKPGYTTAQEIAARCAFHRHQNQDKTSRRYVKLPGCDVGGAARSTRSIMVTADPFALKTPLLSQL